MYNQSAELEWDETRHFCRVVNDLIKVDGNVTKTSVQDART